MRPSTAEYTPKNTARTNGVTPAQNQTKMPKTVAMNPRIRKSLQ
jgi:hypothetical protein